MSRRFALQFSMQSVNLALVASLGILGCGEAKQLESLETAEVHDGVVGTLHARIASYEDHAETTYTLLRDDGQEISLDFAGKTPGARPGERIAVRGPQDGQRIQVDGYDVVRRHEDQVRQNLTVQPTKRTIRIAAISLTTAMTNAKLKARVFTDADSPASFYRDNSYGDWTLTGDVFGPYTISIANCNDNNLKTIAADAKAAAQADGMDPTQYDNFMYYMPTSANCSWGGIAEVGINEVRTFYNAVDSWYNGSGCIVLAQELGHNFGLLHSHTCTGGPYSASSYLGSSCPGYSEYGDQNTPMGNGCGHFNAPEMGALKFITGCNTLDVTSTGTYEIGPIETKCAGPQVIRVPTGTTVNQGPQYIYAEYRKGKGTIGTDTKSPAGVHFHASAEYGGNRTSGLPDAGNHDLDWAVDPFSIGSPLATANSTWTEPVSKAVFKVTAIGATATVEVTIPNSTPSAAKCVDGNTPPATPMCGVVTDAGAPDTGTGTGGAGGAPSDASTDRGGAAGTGGTAGADAGPDSGPGGTAGKAGSGGAAGSGGTTGGGAGTGGAAGKAGSGGSSGSSGSGGAGTGGSAGVGGSGTSGSGGSSGSGTGGSTTGGTKGGASGSGPAPDEGGCGCTVPGGTRTSNSHALLLGLAALVPALRRRRAQKKTA